MILDQHNSVSPHVNTDYVSRADAVSRRDTIAANGALISLLYTRDGRHLLSSSADQRLRQWDAQTGLNTLVHYAETKQQQQMRPLALSANSEHVYYSNQNQVFVYERRTGKLLKRLKAHMGAVHAIAVDTLLHNVYSCAADGEIIRWATPAGDGEASREAQLSTIDPSQAQRNRRDSRELEQQRGENIWTES